MKWDYAIIPECYGDTLLVETLLPPDNGYNHQKGCNQVARVMTGRFKDRFAVGIIDKDKRAVKYLEEFEMIDEVKDSLFLFKHRRRSHFFIQIQPGLEAWILKICNEEKIELDALGNTVDEITEYTKVNMRKKNPDIELKKLFTEIGRKKENQKVKKLIGWLTLLKEKKLSG